MSPKLPFSRISRRALLSVLATLPALSEPLLSIAASAQTATSGGPLPSWNDGPAKQAIIDLVKTTTDEASPDFVPPAARIATFDQDGTTWVEHPIYTQVVYCLDRVPAVRDRSRNSNTPGRSKPCFPATARRSASSR